MRGLFLLLLALPSVVFAAAESESHWQWFPVRPRVFRALAADPREAQLRVGVLRADVGKSFLDLGFGGQLPLARWEEGDRAFEIAAKGLTTSRFQFGSRSFDLQNSDMIGGLAGSYRAGPHAVEVLVSHQSSHLGDDASLQRAPINYSFEALRALYAEELAPRLRAYFGFDVRLRADPSRLRGKMSFIGGGDWRFLPSVTALYAAVDVRFKGDNSYTPNVTLVVAYELGDPLAPFRQRLFLELFDGYSLLGQFDQQRESYVMLGMGFTL